jgi:hypothetical protein
VFLRLNKANKPGKQKGKTELFLSNRMFMQLIKASSIVVYAEN